MSTITKSHLLRLCDLLAEHRGISHWRVSALVRAPKGSASPGDGQYFRRLKAGGESVPSTMEQVARRFSEIWPSGLDWPADIPRPSAKEMPDRRKPLNTTKPIETGAA